MLKLIISMDGGSVCIGGGGIGETEARRVGNKKEYSASTENGDDVDREFDFVLSFGSSG